MAWREASSEDALSEEMPTLISAEDAEQRITQLRQRREGQRLEEIAEEIRKSFRQSGTSYTEAEVQESARELFTEYEKNRYDEDWYHSLRQKDLPRWLRDHLGHFRRRMARR